MTLGINDTQHNNTHYAECPILFVVMLSAIMLIVVVLFVVMLSVVASRTNTLAYLPVASVAKMKIIKKIVTTYQEVVPSKLERFVLSSLASLF